MGTACIRPGSWTRRKAAGQRLQSRWMRQQVSDADGSRGIGCGGRVAETPESLRKSGERGSGRRRREERRVSEGRYGDFERSDEGGVKGLS